MSENETPAHSGAPVHVLIEKVPEAPATRAWWDHPIARALGAFALTTVVGTIITTSWQTKQWTEQQAYAARAERAKVQMEVAKNVAERVSDAFSASNQVLYLTLLDAHGKAARVRDKQLQASIEEWLRQNRTWHVDESVLTAQTTAHFSRSSVHLLAAHVFRKRQQLFKQMTTFIEVSRGEPVPPAPHPRRDKMLKINEQIYPLMVNTLGDRKLLPLLTREMIDEMREEQTQRSGS